MESDQLENNQLENIEQDVPGTTGGEERDVPLRPVVKEELWRVLATRDVYKSVSHAIWDYLDRSLLPRIERGDYSSPKLAAELTGATAGRAREQTRLSMPDWEQVEEAVLRANRDLRRWEEQAAWEGRLRSVPFCKIEPKVIVRAAAREIAEFARGAPCKRYSREEMSGGAPWEIAGPGPGNTNSGDESPGDANSGDGELSGRGPGGPVFQTLPRLPGRERAGKLITFCITTEAKDRLDCKAGRLNLSAADLARRSTLKLIRWVDESPTEASEYIRAKSSLYWPLGKTAEDRDYSGFQVRVPPMTKRHLEQARRRLEQIRESPGRRCEKGPGRYASQKEILQAAARLALESEDMRPPLPGKGRDRQGRVD